MARILVVEDNADLVFALRSALEMDGHELLVADSGPAGVELARQSDPDLVLLDVMLPGFDGFRVLRTLRESGFVAPVLMLTARGTEEDKVRGLRVGADDYVTKPFGAMELLARVEALLRRPRVPARWPSAPHTPSPMPGAGSATAAGAPSGFGDVTVDLASRTVRRAGTPVTLSPRAYDLLAALLARRGAVASREELLQQVWGYAEGVNTRTVDIHVVELRRKLEVDSAAPRHILTVRKAGYRIEP